MRLVGAPPQTTCSWVFDEGDGQPRSYNGPCGEEVRIRLAAGKPTVVTVDAAVPDGPPQRATTEVVVRDLLIAGLGDSVAAGEGNPDRPVALSDEGFCFRRFITGAHSEYYRPGRAGFKGGRTCDSGRGASELAEWSALGARWLSQACHRSLYGYQLRTALALAVENPHVAVTFLPLACTGASIDNGVLSSQRARELNCTTNRPCPSTVPAQVTQLQQYLTAARRGRGDRMLDLVLLTVGANDIDFSGLVANVIIDATTDRVLVGRRDPDRRGCGERAAQQPSGQLRQAARGVAPDGRRRSLARRVRFLRAPGVACRWLAVRRRPGRVRRASGIQARRRAAAPDLEFHQRALPAAAQGDRPVRRRRGPAPTPRPTA